MWIMYKDRVIKFEEINIGETYVSVYNVAEDAYFTVAKYEKPEQAQLALSLIARAISEDKKVFRMPNQAEIETASIGSITDYAMIYNFCTTRFEAVR